MRNLLLAVIFGCGLITALPSKATLITYNMAWTGDAGYSMAGMFSFDDEDIPSDSLIREGWLDTFMISFFDPSGVLLRSYDIDTVVSLFNFNFETDTEIIRQSGFRPGDFNFWAGRDIGFGHYFLTAKSFCTGGPALFFDGLEICSNKIDQGGTITATRKSVPEPTTLALLSLGLAGLGVAKKKKKI